MRAQGNDRRVTSIHQRVCIAARGGKKENMTAFSHLAKYLFCVIQESCARVLLFRGANKEIKNYNSQTAFQVRLTLN